MSKYTDYIVIPKKDIEDRIKELTPQSVHNSLVGEYDSEGDMITIYQEILSNSKPLLPIIEDAFDEGIKNFEIDSYGLIDIQAISKSKEEYLNKDIKL